MRQSALRATLSLAVLAVALTAGSAYFRAAGAQGAASFAATSLMGPAPHAPAVFTQQGPKLVGSGIVGPIAYQGLSVAVSADGSTAIVGGYQDNGQVGAAWVWTRSAGVWTQQGPKLVGSGAVGNARQGVSVSVSADGNTALVGGYGDNSFAGAAWVWTRSGGVWTQQGPKLVGSGVVGNGGQGAAVSLSGDGNTAIVGGNLDNSLEGAAWVWTRTGGVWTQQGSKLVGSNAGGTAHKGTSVSLSADGQTALVGGWGANATLGATWVWTRSGGVWAQQGPTLIGSNSGTGAEQGLSVSLSADGNTAIVGGSGDNNLDGAAWVWTRSGGIWTQQGAKLVGSGASTSAGQGSSVSLSADGNTAIVGGGSDNLYAGAAWVWTRSGGVWTQQGPKLVGSGAVGKALQGGSVSLSADGNTAFVGGADDNAGAGAAWVFVSPASRATGDLDGDGKSDRTIFRPSTGIWYSLLSAGGARATAWGVSTDVDVSADYDGDGKADLAVWRPSTGQWFILQSSTSTVRVDDWGVSGDIPLAGDVDGDGKADLVIWRPSTGVWFVKKSTGGSSATNWGISTDQPLLGDYDGDGKTDLTIYRTGVWYILKSSGGTSIVAWGIAGDIPLVGDYDGDGKADPTVFRPSTGEWFITKSSGGTLVVNWGVSGDIPLSGDQDGEGKSDFILWRPSTGIWYTQFASGGAAAVQWGVTGDRPVGRVPGS